MCVWTVLVRMREISTISRKMIEAPPWFGRLVGLELTGRERERRADRHYRSLTLFSRA